jgi:2-polyprenyl-3-methyl-5-hydroxy-6-metoxy-1,4-benzoquinol methylase
MRTKSPLTNNQNIKRIKNIPVKTIINNWKTSNINVERFFNNLKKINIYECLDTGYKFYYPLNLEGDDQFYQDLQQFDWYYFDWKWEYDQALEQIGEEKKILEIGCGPGDFLIKLKKRNCDCTGLEFNQKALEKSRGKGLTVIKETIQEHSKNNQGKYDVVISFQVMEHIARIDEAIRASLDCLKPDGQLIISVPNNDSFIKKDKDPLLNMPPHHMGLWNKRSLVNLEKYFDLKLKNIYREPLQKYHYKNYYNLFLGEKINKLFGRLSGKVNVIPRKLFFYLLNHGLAKKITGHTIMAIYNKK